MLSMLSDMYGFFKFRFIQKPLFDTSKTLRETVNEYLSSYTVLASLRRMPHNQKPLIQRQTSGVCGCNAKLTGIENNGRVIRLEWIDTLVIRRPSYVDNSLILV